MRMFVRGRWTGHAILTSVAAIAVASAAHAEPLTETEAVQRALALPDFDALGAAEREVATARTRAIPRFENPQATLSRESVSGSAGGETEWHGEVSQPIDISGRRSSLRRAARLEAEAVAADVSRRRQIRAAEVREAYAGCAAASEKSEIHQRFAERLREAERIVTLRTSAGDTAGYDLRRLRVEARTAEAQAQLAEGNVRAECVTLSLLTGVADAEPATPLAALVPALPVAAAAAAARQDISAREARVAAATAEVRAAERSRIPDFTVGLGAKRLSNEDGSAVGPTISVGARIPLFSNKGAAISEARARQRVREAELSLARREVQASIAAAAARAAAAIAAAREAREAADDAARLGTIAEAAYQGGETGVVELVDAYRTARDAQLEIIDLTERAVRATIEQSLAEGRDL